MPTTKNMSVDQKPFIHYIADDTQSGGAEAKTLAITENGTYPVIGYANAAVNVEGGGTEYNIKCYTMELEHLIQITDVIASAGWNDGTGDWEPVGDVITKAHGGDVLALKTDIFQGTIGALSADDSFDAMFYPMDPDNSIAFIMPAHDVYVLIASR